MKELFETGKTKDKVVGFTSKAGNIFDACLKFEDNRISFDFDNPGSGAVNNAAGTVTGTEDTPTDAFGDRAFLDDMDNHAQYIDEDMSAFYDTMADEMAAYQEMEMQEQLLGDTFLLDNQE